MHILPGPDSLVALWIYVRERVRRGLFMLCGHLQLQQRLHGVLLQYMLRWLVGGRGCDNVHLLLERTVVTFRLNIVRRVRRALQLPRGKLQRRNV